LASSDDFREFYRASYGRTLATVAALVGSNHEAEDIAQEAYARALARWSWLHGFDLPDAWVRKVAVRLAVDSSRRRRTRLAATLRLASLRQPQAPQPDDDLRYTPPGAALLDLPIRERQVVVLHYLADLSVDAIAQECGLAAGTVKTRLAAGRRHLAERLAQYPEAVS
jgi:RNA polymerase sigma-70 factor (ECF subfamily)